MYEVPAFQIQIADAHGSCPHEVKHHHYTNLSKSRLEVCAARFQKDGNNKSQTKVERQRQDPMRNTCVWMAPAGEKGNIEQALHAIQAWMWICLGSMDCQIVLYCKNSQAFLTWTAKMCSWESQCRGNGLASLGQPWACISANSITYRPAIFELLCFLSEFRGMIISTNHVHDINEVSKYKASMY